MSTAFVVLIAVFALSYLAGAPLGYGLTAAGICYLLVSGSDLGQAAEIISGSLNSNFELLAVPLFIFAAELMNRSGLTDRIFRFAQLLLGRTPGALAQVNVLGTFIFSGMSGSAIADASGIGVMSVRAMARQGYPRAFACATTATSAITGPLMPPSIPLVIYGFLASTSVGMLFAAGILPAIVMALGHVALIGYLARRRGFRKDLWPGWLNVTVAAVATFPAVIAPAILIGGIYSGVFTPTESSAVACLYVVLVAFLIYRSMSPRTLWEALAHATRQAGSVTSLIAGSFLVNYAVAREGIAAAAAGAVIGLTHNALLILLIVNVLFLIGHLFLDTVVLQFILLPLTLPVVTAAHIDLVYFGVVITLNMMIGLGLPTLGVVNFLLSKLTGTPLKDIIREMWPFLGYLVAGLALLILVPDISLAIPHLLGYHGSAGVP